MFGIDILTSKDHGAEFNLYNITICSDVCLPTIKSWGIYDKLLPLIHPLFVLSNVMFPLKIVFAYLQLLNKLYENEVALREQRIPLKCCQPLDFWYAFFKRFRFFIAVSMKSVGQLALKLLAVKV